MVLLGTFCFSQNYYFYNKQESIKYSDSYGQTQYQVISNDTSTYKFYFELSADGKGTQLFTVYKNNEEIYWAAELKKSGYTEVAGKIFKQSLYYNTASKENIYVFISRIIRELLSCQVME